MDELFAIDHELQYAYELTLCKPNYEPIQQLENIYGFVYEAKFPTTDEISFNIPFYIMNKGIQEKNSLWDLIRGDYVIHLKRVFDENLIDEKYFMVINPKETDSDGQKIKEIVAYSIEYELNKKIIRSYKFLSRQLHTVGDITDAEGFYIGILNYITSNLTSSWTVGYVDGELIGKYRAFDVSEKTVLAFLIDDVQKAFGCVFLFDTVNKEINVRKIESIGQDKGFYISEENFIQAFNTEIKHDEIVTRLYVYGKDGISIRDKNPTGVAFVEDFSFYRNEEYMSQALLNALNDYDALLATKTGEFDTYKNQLDAKYDDLAYKRTWELNPLLNDLAIIQHDIDIAIQTGNQSLLSSKNSEKNAKQSQINAVQSEIDQILVEINNLSIQIANLQSQLNRNNHFSADLLKELDFFVKESTWSDTSYETSDDLWEEMPNIFMKINQPPIHIEVDSVDFTKLKEGQRNWKKFILGDILNVEHTKFNFFIQLRLVGYTHDPESHSLNLIFSSRESLDDPNHYLNELMKNAITAGTTLDMSKFKWDLSEKNNSEITQIINNAWDAAKNAVLAGANQDIVIDERGILLRDSTNENDQMKIINNVLAMTNDNWNTVKMAITPGKIYTDYLYGNVLAGANVFIDTGDGKFRVDQEGVTISGTQLTVTEDGTSYPFVDFIQRYGSDFSVTISPTAPLNPKDGDLWQDSSTDILYVYDASANAGLGDWINTQNTFTFGSQPTNPKIGDFWRADDTSSLKVWNGSQWIDADNALRMGESYNNVVINTANGLVATNSYNTVKTTLNATSGIKIEQQSGGVWTPVLFADSAGNLNIKGTLAAGSIISNSAIIGGNITIGSGTSVFKASTTGIWLGNESYSSAPFRVSPAGTLTATSAVIIGNITANQLWIGGTNVITSGNIDGQKVVNISASNITTGTLSADRISTNISQVSESLTIGSASANDTWKTLTFVNSSTRTARIQYSPGTYSMLHFESGHDIRMDAGIGFSLFAQHAQMPELMYLGVGSWGNANKLAATREWVLANGGSGTATFG
jgi:hypothetical protein